MRKSGVKAEEIDLIIVATITPDMPFPSTACLVQQKIDAYRAAAFDIEAACSGFIFALEIGQQFIMSRTYNTVLVIGAENFPRSWTGPTATPACCLAMARARPFCKTARTAHGLLTACMGPTAKRRICFPCPAAAAVVRPARNPLPRGCTFLRMDGKETFKNAVQAMNTAAQESLRRCEIDISQIKCIIPHQANRRIIDAVSERLAPSPSSFCESGQVRKHFRGVRGHCAGRGGGIQANPARGPDFAGGFRGGIDVGRGGDRMVKSFDVWTVSVIT